MKLIPLAVAALSGTAFSFQFTETEAEYRAFGLITWPWVTELDDGAGGVDRYIWFAEDGGRVRFLNPFSGLWEPSPHVPDAVNPAPRRHADTYRDLEIFQPDLAVDQWCGLVVGDDGQWAWSMGDLTQPGSANLVWNDLAPFSVTNPFGATTAGPDLFGIHVITEATGPGTGPRIWFVGENHTLAYTDNLSNPTAGITIPSVTPYPNSFGTNGTLRGITFAPNGQNGIAVGDSIAYYTTDGGLTWEPSLFSFIPENEPGGGPGGTAGKTPISLPAPMPAFTGSQGLVTELWAGVLDRTTTPTSSAWEGFIVGGNLVQSGQYFFRSSNSGATWIQERSTCKAFGATCDLTDDCPTPSNFEPCTGTAWDLGNDGGGNSSTTLYTVHRMPNGDVLAGGYLGQTYRRPAGASGLFSWEDVSEYCDPNIDATTIWGIHGAPGSDFAMVAGNWGEAKSTPDSGLTWNSETPYRRWRFNDMESVLSPTGGLAALYTTGQNLRIARSLDGGSTWTQQRGIEGWTVPNFGASMAEIAVFNNASDNLDDDIGVAVGAYQNGGPVEPYILYTLDGGSTCWLEADLSGIVWPTTGARQLMSVAYNQNASGAGNLVFVATSDRGEIIRSTDSGATWSFVDQPTTRSLNSVTMATENVVIFGGGNATDGDLLISFNLGSASPTIADATPLGSTPSRINSVHTNRYQAYAAGDDGQLWQYVGGGQFVLVSGLPGYAAGLDLTAVRLAEGPGPIQLMVGGVSGLLMEHDGTSFERHHSGVSNDINDIAMDGGSGFHFLTITDRVLDALGTSEVLFGPVAQPTFMYSTF